MMRTLLILMLLCGAVQAQVLPLDAAVRTGRLANGFRYYIRHNEEPKQRVVMYLANKVGSVLEADDQQGLAHFMEHMGFNGTKHFPKNELVNYLQQNGVRFGADLNAYTSFDETVYQLPLPAGDPVVVKNGLQIMRDWAKGATLDPLEIDKERGVVLEERRLGQGASERLRRQTLPVLLNGSRYAVRLPIGTEEVLKNFKPEAIQRYYRDWYRPDLQALVVVGDIDVNLLEKQVRALFGDLRNPPKERVRTKYRVPLMGRNQFLAAADKELTSTTAQVVIKYPAAELKTVQDYRGLIARQLFNQLLGERLAELGRRAEPPFVRASAGIGKLLGNLDAFTVTVVSRPGELEQGIKAAWREVSRVQRLGFTATELERAKQEYLSVMAAQLKEKDKTPSEALVKEYVRHFLNGEAAPGISREYALVQQALPAITLADMAALAKTYIKPVDRDIILTAPEKAGLPTESVTTAWLKAVEAEPVVPYQDRVLTTSLLAAPPVPGTLTDRRYDSQLGLTTWILSNGVKVILKPTKFKNDEVLISAFGPGGTSLYPDADYQSAANAASVVGSFGAGNYDPDQLSRFLAGKQLQARPFISERFQGTRGAAIGKDLETAFQLVYAQFTAPRRDTALFKNIISRSRASLLNRSADPATVFQDTVSAVLGNYHLRRLGPTIAGLEEISLDRSYGIYRERLGDASGLTFVLVGSIDTAAIKPLVLAYIGGLPSTNRKVAAKDLGIRTPPGRLEKKVYKGKADKATVRLVFSGEMAYSAGEVVQLGALKEALQFRLTERLREEESGVYSPSVQASASKLPAGRYSLVVSFGCSPANVERLTRSVNEEIEKLRSAGPPAGNIAKFQAEERSQRELQLRSNTFWLNYLEAQLQNEEPLASYTQFEERLKAVSPASVQAAAKQYLSGNNYIRLELLPEK